MVRKVLFVCGILSSLLYVFTDVLAATRWEGYSYTSQSISELMAIGAPTRPLMISLLIPYGVLVIAFGVGVWASAGRKRAGRLTGALLVGYGVVGFLGLLLFPMNLRGAERTQSDTGHIVVTSLIVLFLLLMMGFGATVHGAGFRLYSIGTILILLLFGAWAGMDGPRIAAQLPTPWAGVKERINVYASLLWVMVLAISLVRIQGAVAPDQPGKPTVIPQEGDPTSSAGQQ
jgi:hypothetical protein